MATLDQAITRGTLAARPSPSAGTAGRLYFVTDDNSVWRDNGAAWESYNRPLGTTAITAAAGNHTHAHSSLTGIGANDHHNQSHTLQGGDHPDVSTAAPSNGQALVYNSGISKYEPQTITAGMANPMTTVDDLIVGGASGTPARLAKGTDGQVLTVDPSTHHLVWATPSSGMANPMTTAGDLILAGASGTPTRLAKGADNQLLTIDPTTHLPVWATPTAGTSTLAAETDVAISSPAAGDRLGYDSGTSKWKNVKEYASLAFVIDGGGATITTGIKGDLIVPFDCTILQATLLGDQSGSIVVDVWKTTYASYDAGTTHPVSGDKITASAPPTISSATKSQDSTLTGWTTTLSAGDILRFTVNSVSTLQRVTLALRVSKR